MPIAKPPVGSSSWIVERHRIYAPCVEQTLQAEGSIEHHALLFALMSPTTRYIKLHPHAVFIESRGNSYTTDMVRAFSKTAICCNEFKQSTDAEKPKNVAKYKQITSEFEEANTAFSVVTERQLNAICLYANAKILCRYFHQKPPSKNDKMMVLDIAKRHGPMFMLSLIRLAQRKKIQYASQIVWFLLAHQQLDADLAQVLTSRSRIWLNKESGDRYAF
ncbi:hypothetical protein GCM10011369_18810 [Neiella marina]|uniref:TnsA endonuclease N-terminal domain-containing protein n=2 Tax=Neiella marina TaxID=508461 RepID=A0A8J2U565_9GAMM|nr:hypothetical protein [Neiella marina]GGA77192.1 hypothetical protein GCM10011369_18810 [Neiella marina]